MIQPTFIGLPNASGVKIISAFANFSFSSTAARTIEINFVLSRSFAGATLIRTVVPSSPRIMSTIFCNFMNFTSTKSFSPCATDKI